MKPSAFSDRPRLRPAPGFHDRVINGISATLLVLFWIFSAAVYAKLPETIPTHYNASGKADEFGNKTSFLMLPVVASIIFAGLTIIGRYPYSLNYLTKITEDNALKQYTLATQLLGHLKLATVIVFSVISCKTVLTAEGRSEGLGQWYLPLSFFLFIVPVIVYMVRSVMNR